MNAGEKHCYLFKSFRLDIEQRRLLRCETRVPLTPKAFDVLAVLVEHSGHLVEKDELLESVWANTLVEESNVTRIVHTLRKALGENDNGNKFIETVAKKGYRFVAEVTEIHEPREPNPKSENGHFSSAARKSSEPASAEKTDETVLRPNSGSPGIVGPPAGQTKPLTRIDLFGIGFLSVIFLFFLLSYNFQSSPWADSKKIKSIAVLPLIPIDSAQRDEIYEIGIADSLIYRLNSMKSIVVRPLSATRRYTDLRQDPVAAGRQQQVDYVIAASYQQVNGKIRVTAQLINVATGQIEATGKSEKMLGDMFGTQDAIANDLGNNLLARFAETAGRPQSARGTANEEAYRLYLQGRNLTDQRSPKDAARAIEYFERALRLDPNFAQAYAGMAFAYRASGSLGGGLPREQFARALEAVTKALELDADLAEAYAIRGDLKHKYEMDWTGAESDLLRAIELEPGNDLAHSAYGQLLAERYGRFDEALAEEDLALTINPGSLVYQRDRGRIFYFARRYDEAIVQLQRVIELDENFQTAYVWLWLAYAMKGDEAQAYEYLMRFQKRAHPDRVEPLRKAYETAGWQGLLRKLLELQKLSEHRPGSSYYQMARICALLGDKEQAFEYLNKTIEKGHSQIVMLNVEPGFDSLRDDPRFDELLGRIGFK